MFMAETIHPLIGSVHAESIGTPEQQRVYGDIREYLKPYEEHLHKLAAFLAPLNEMPQGVHKRRRKTYIFSSIEEGKELEIRIRAQKRQISKEWACKWFEIDGNRLIFNGEGMITALEFVSSYKTSRITEDLQRELGILSEDGYGQEWLKFRFGAPGKMAVLVGNLSYDEKYSAAAVHVDLNGQLENSAISFEDAFKKAMEISGFTHLPINETD